MTYDTRHSNNVPIYLQQLQFGNLRLYHYQQLIGWKYIVYRKRDTLVCLHGHKKPPLGTKLGELKEEEPPELNCV